METSRESSTSAAVSESSPLLPTNEAKPSNSVAATVNEAETSLSEPLNDSNVVGGIRLIPPDESIYNRSLSVPNSRAPSRQASPAVTSHSLTNTPEELPTNVSSSSQLSLLPDECKSRDNTRPLRHIDEQGNEFHYHLRPMFYSVVFILAVELLERFAFYGVNYTQTSYLTGVYSKWNADMEAVDASTYVSVSVAVAYTTPFVGAFLADHILGEYWTLIVGSTCFYLPGLTLIALTTIPGALGEEFNKKALALGLLVLWPIGTGVVKSVVNVFGAKQFHPLLQASLIEAYYVKFYMCINIGALVGGILVPLTAQKNITIAYTMPVVMLTLGILTFLLGSRRYIISAPKGESPLPCLHRGRSKKYLYDDFSAENSIPLSVIFRICLLIIPFNIAYSQMATTFIVQGTVMRKAFGWIDAACMNNADAISVLLFGYLIGSFFYPQLSMHNIKIPTTYKFAIGSALGAMAVGWALIVEYLISKRYREDGMPISILWQTVSYVLIGAGEIFAVSAAYEVAFTAAPPEKKVLASAVNLFCIGGLPNVFCIGLYHACRPWFRNSRGTTNITRLSDYAGAHTDRYFLLLLGIALCGVGVNLLPGVRRFVESVEDQATELIKTPKTPLRPPLPERRREAEEDSDDEEAVLRRAKRHRDYLKYGSGPQLFKMGSMRAGPSLSERKSIKHPKRSDVQRLYQSESSLPKDVAKGVLPLRPRAFKPLSAFNRANSG